MKLSAFKFIGYYDENSLRIYETCKGLNSNNVSKIYYYKDYSEYLFLKGVEKRVPTVKELERIHIYVMQKEMCKKEWLLRLGTSTAALMLIYLLKYAYGMCQDKQEDIYAKQEVQVMKEVEKYNYAIDYTDIKNKLIDMINLAEVSLVDRNYRILYYLYYAAFVNDLDNYDFLENIIPKYGGNARLSYQDLFAFYISDKFNYSSVISDPKGDSLKVTYENLDMFLELNI
ncbi:MAG: hypothetical protein K2G03_02250, partial [Bacilli bacterium]|nr:hypothetical protein [Bacilli bacterium]